MAFPLSPTNGQKSTAAGSYITLTPINSIQGTWA
jgi:hypothetical protein